MLSKLWGISSFCLVLILLAVVKKYLLNAFAISWRSLIEFPSQSWYLPVLLVSKFTVSQIVLFLFEDFLNFVCII